MELSDGKVREFNAIDLMDNPLPRELRIRKVRFHIRKGRLYHYDELQFEGLKSITEKEARSYFVETGFLLHLRGTRIFTPEKLRRGMANLEDAFQRKGYESVKVTASPLIASSEPLPPNLSTNTSGFQAEGSLTNLVTIDPKTGAARVRITVQQGPKSIVRSVREEIYYEQEAEARQTRTVQPNQPYSKLWAQDFIQSLKTNQFHRGYPDTEVELKPLKREPEGNRIFVDLLATVKSGPQVHIGNIEFRGEKRTRPALMARRVRIKRGDLLDRIKVEEGRSRLALLGIFDTVSLTYAEPPSTNHANAAEAHPAEKAAPTQEQHTRDVIYSVKEAKIIDVSLLFGYGSYELLRGGFEIEQRNIWGLAHHTRLKAVQSFKASSGEFVYTIPEMLGRDFDLFFNASALRREEVSFIREEYGGGAGVHKFFKAAATDLTVRYNYQILNAADVPRGVAVEGITNSNVGAIITEIKHDRRDNPLYPRKGYKVFSTLELASEYLAGDVNYQRLEISPSWHQPLGGGRYFNLGVSHGVILTIGSTAEDLPFNKRFFPGGENSIRGYQEGEASPRNAEGKSIGAETYTLGTVEFEQSLTPRWSLVVFSDSLGFALRSGNYPFDTGLFSVGGGLRWRTIIGPVRVEYGYNLNPRPRDPVGTLHFSLGFPF
jgi:outer membrane protein insertion porin family